MGNEGRTALQRISEDEIAAYEPEPWRASLAEKLQLGKAVRPEYDPVRLDINSRTLQLNGSDSVLLLSDFEYQILWLLMRARKTTNAIVTSQEISEFIYQNYPEGHLERISNVENLICAEMSSLRGKMDSFTKEIFIRTERGFGYRLGLRRQGEESSIKGSKRARLLRTSIAKKRGD